MVSRETPTLSWVVGQDQATATSWRIIPPILVYPSAFSYGKIVGCWVN
ncbi:MAG: hypothetical protein WCS37_12450 [Chloroflexota bacterium]